MNILITGGAGFIGTHLTRRLLGQGHSVTILDNFLPQVHGPQPTVAADLVGKVRVVTGDIADQAAVQEALDGAEAVAHLAAETGTGQSMYEVSRYGRTNLQGTAELYDCLVRHPQRVARVVCASSRAIYGEGAYRCDTHGVVYPKSRSTADKQSGHFDPLCPECLGACESIATPESAPAQPSSFYGLTKLGQEQMALLFGPVLQVPTIALRYQNVYGPGQSLRNPYTGILAVFSNLARAGEVIRIFEDGLESRDFVYIDDIVNATVAALTAPVQGSHVINVGSGWRTTVLEVAQQVNRYFGENSKLQIVGSFRDGDIRHGFADIAAARQILGYEPRWTFARGLEQFLNWSLQSEVSLQGYEASLAEMRDKGLLHG